MLPRSPNTDWMKNGGFRMPRSMKCAAVSRWLVS
jgi:hypothetical protein